MAPFHLGIRWARALILWPGETLLIAQAHLQFLSAAHKIRMVSTGY